ncbi:DUF2281 domain-containing protein [Dyadobacter arcticus]|uniref:DUF2281 domain-containing protein n=1 Tax=Dyadobacter arcticus TaxID=1078754 RepID=A0ABX0UFL8_9BACT|nr:DUF2281 domain-containing protein [Dyadobacter arcticus]NIJ51796.1 hypothetical protein [Dyadobacter arcticus]
MTDLKLYTKISMLPAQQKSELVRIIDSLNPDLIGKKRKTNKRVAGKAKGLIEMKDNFDEPFSEFHIYK